MRRRPRPRLALVGLESRINPGNLTITNALIVDANNNPQPDPVVGEDIYLRAEWRTSGLTSSDHYVTRYWVDGRPGDSATLTGQAGNNLGFSWYRSGWWLGPGPHTVTVTVDGADQVGESDETDNTITFQVTPVEPASLPAKFTFPLGGAAYQDWSFVNYADIDPTSPGFADFRGGPFTYDFHDAWDITLPNFTRMDAGVPDIAAADGTVVEAVDGNFDRETAQNSNPGNFVRVDHGNGWSTLYYHLMKGSVTVHVGDHVTRGQILGLAASSGSSSDPHLHFTPYFNGCQVETMFDPAAYWFYPPAYQGDLPTTVTDAGMTNESPFDDMKERPPEVDTFPTSSGWDAWFWYRASQFKPGDEVRVFWYQPDGTLNTTYGYDASTYDVYNGSGWVLPASTWAALPGVWHVALSVNGTELTRLGFAVTPGAGDAAIRLSQGSTYVIDGRTTALDFGSVAVGAAAPTQTYTVQNLGSTPLALTGLALPPNFALVGALPSAIPGGSSASFTLKMTTTAVGPQWGEVRFVTTDPHHPTFRFAATGTVTGTAPAGAPVVTLDPAALGYTLGRPAAALDPAATVTDADSATFDTGSLAVQLAFGGQPADVLGVANGGTGPGQIGLVGTVVSYAGTAIGTVTGGAAGVPLVVSFNANATPEAVQALVGAVTFADLDPAAPTNPRRVRLTLTDDAGNVSNLAEKTVIAYSVVFPGPAVTAVGPVTPDPRNSAVDTVDVTFSEPLQAGTFDPTDVILTRDGGANLIDGGVTVMPLTGDTYRVAGLAGLTAAEGTYALTVSAVGVVDYLGLAGSGTGSANWTVDTTPPQVTINQAAGQPDPTNAGPIRFDVQFGEPVVGFGASGLTLTSAIGDTLSASASPGPAANSYVVSVTGMTGSGTVTAVVKPGAAADLAGNASLGSTSTDNAVDYDVTPPAVTVNRAAAQGDPAGGPLVTFDVVFSEPVVGFDGSKVDMSASTTPGTLIATVAGAGPSYTVTVTGMTGGGTVAATIDPGAVTDPAGNANLASTGTDNSVDYVHSGTVQFSADSYSVPEQAGSRVMVTVRRTGGSDGPLDVHYATADGTAAAGSDYTAASGDLHWDAGDAADKTFTVAVLDDGGFEGDSAFSVNLSSASVAGALGTPAAAAVTILEQAVLAFTAPKTSGDEGTTVHVPVRRAFGTHGAVSVDYTLAAGTATADTDYSAPATGTLTWPDGDATDQFIDVAIAADGLSEGKETVLLTLTNPAGTALLGDQSTATLTINASNGTTIAGNAKTPKATVTDSDGDVLTLALGGKLGSMTYYLTNGAGPVSEIDLSVTDSAKSVVSLAVKKQRGGTGDGRTTLLEVNGTGGVRSLSLAKADLIGDGISLNEFVGSLTIGDVRNGADLTLGGFVSPLPRNSATRITAGVIGDGTDIVVMAPLGSLTATAVGDGTITAPNVGNITVKGKRATRSTPGIAGDFESDLTINGLGIDPVKGKALKSLRVAGTVSGAMIRVEGNVGSVSAGSFVDSRLFAGYDGPDAGDPSAFTGDFTVGPFRVTGTAGGFVRSYVVASRLKTVTLAGVDPTISGSKFGFVYHAGLTALTVKAPAFRVDPKGPAVQDLAGTDFEVKRV